MQKHQSQNNSPAIISQGDDWCCYDYGWSPGSACFISTSDSGNSHLAVYNIATKYGKTMCSLGFFRNYFVVSKGRHAVYVGMIESEKKPAIIDFLEYVENNQLDYLGVDNKSSQ